MGEATNKKPPHGFLNIRMFQAIQAPPSFPPPPGVVKTRPDRKSSLLSCLTLSQLFASTNSLSTPEFLSITARKSRKKCKNANSPPPCAFWVYYITFSRWVSRLQRLIFLILNSSTMYTRELSELCVCTIFWRFAGVEVILFAELAPA